MDARHRYKKRVDWLDIYLIPNDMYNELREMVMDIDSADMYSTVMVEPFLYEATIRFNYRFVSIPKGIESIGLYEFDHDVSNRIGITSYILHWMSKRYQRLYQGMTAPSELGPLKATVFSGDRSFPLVSIFSHYDKSAVATYNINDLFDHFGITRKKNSFNDEWTIKYTTKQLKGMLNWSL